MEDAPLLTIVEEALPFPCGQGYICAGSASDFAGFTTIRFARSEAVRFDVLFHELSHVAYRRFRPEESDADVGHGTAKDPFALALTAWYDWLWAVPAGHPYRPRFEFAAPLRTPAGLVLCRIAEDAT